MELKWIEASHSSCRHAFEAVSDLNVLNFEGNECDAVSIPEMRSIVTELVKRERNVDANDVMDYLSNRLKNKEALIPHKKTLATWLKELKEKAGVNRARDAMSACINSTTLNGKRFGRRVVQLRSSEGVDNV